MDMAGSMVAPALLGAAVLLFQIAVGSGEPVALTIGFWNSENLGPSKMGRPEVVSTFVGVIEHYDVVVLQEVRDITGDTPGDLLTAVNAAHGGAYAMLASDRYGAVTSSHREQYVYYYRTDRLTPGRTMSWENRTVGGAGSTTLLFERRTPHAVWWRVAGSGWTVATVSLHSSPGHVPEELDALGTVAAELIAAAGPTEGVIVGGDLNADCSYLLGRERTCMRSQTCTSPEINIALGDATDPVTFHWLLDDSADTTTSSSDCAYDRVIVSTPLLPHVVGGAAFVDGFGARLGLNITATTDASNHFPVGLNLTLPAATPSAAPTPSTAPTSPGAGTSDSSSDTDDGMGTTMIAVVAAAAVVVVLVVVGALVYRRKGSSESESGNMVSLGITRL